MYARRLWLDATKPIHVMVNGTKRVWLKHGMGHRSVGLVQYKVTKEAISPRMQM